MSAPPSAAEWNSRTAKVICTGQPARRPVPTAHRPRLFISYSSRDLVVARMVHNLLSSHGFDVWRDERRIERNWSEEIARQLVVADVVVVLWSAGSAASRWVQHEWLTARALNKRIEMCLLPGHPPLPPPLQNLRRLQFGGRTAAEVRRKAALLASRLSRPASTSTRYDFSVTPANAHIPFGHNEQFTGRQRDSIGR
jgi:hypothetical protein